MHCEYVIYISSFQDFVGLLSMHFAFSHNLSNRVFIGVESLLFLLFSHQSQFVCILYSCEFKIFIFFCNDLMNCKA